MSYRNAGVAVAVLSLLASAGFANADSGTATAPVTAPKLSLESSSPMTLDAAVAHGLLMQGADAVGVGSTLDKLGINIYGWVEAGYTYSPRYNQYKSAYETNRVQPGAFNYQHTNSVMLNQISLVVEKTLTDSAAAGKWDVGGKVWVMYGTDSVATHSNGWLQYAGQDAFSPTYQFDIPEVYIDVTTPLKGLTVRVGKFATIIGAEALNPTVNPFYSRSWLYASEPITQTGVLAMYTINDQWSVTGGFTRGWDQTLKDNNKSAIDFLGAVSWTPSKLLNLTTNVSFGPEDAGDTGHYRLLVDPILAITPDGSPFSFKAEGLYVVDGAIAAAGYGDYYGAALYAGYKINDMFTLNARGEAVHFYGGGAGGMPGNNINIYEGTVGVTITPLPSNKQFSGLEIRPEVRYDYSGSDKVFTTPTGAWHDQFTFGGDIIFKF